MLDFLLAFGILLSMLLLPIFLIIWIIRAIQKKPTKRIKLFCLALALVFILCISVVAAISCKHDWSDATCTTPQTCSLCDATQGDVAEHIWISATCTTPKTCSVCNATEGDIGGHVWEAATCTSPKLCSVCGVTEGNALGHKWLDATCTNPLVCSVCAKTTGSALGHDWIDATCTEPSTCRICNTTDNEPLGHTIDRWNTTTASTCIEPGTEEGLCTICGEMVERTLELIDHTSSDWIITVEPTETSDGIHVKKCTYCDTELESESFSLTLEEIEARYKERCQHISYDDLARTPDDYKDEYVTFSGKVVQVCSEASSFLYYSTYRVATSGSYNDIVLIYVDNYGSGERILEDDRITFYGTYDGLYSYTTVMGAQLTIPSIKVKYID